MNTALSFWIGCYFAVGLLLTKSSAFVHSICPRTTDPTSKLLKMTFASDDESAIRKLLNTYESSLNTSDADLAASLYTADGVFMPTTLPTATGTEALKESYSAIFGNIQLAVKFQVNELVVTSDTSAYALTESKGKVTIKATGANPSEANREIFVFAKEGGAWKIARYMFNKSS